jgi:dCTP deaminase
MERGVISITPFNEKNLANTSYDVRLGEWYYEQRVLDKNEIFNPFYEKHVQKVYGDPKQAKPVSEYTSPDNPFHNLLPTDRVIILNPGEMILGHTIEFIGGHNRTDLGIGYTTEMRARSSVGRIGIGVCKCAGWGDIGYVNRWTMEISNFSSSPIVLPVGMRIAQIIFHQTDPIESNDEYTSLTGKYQTSKSLDELMVNWSPDQMLPKLYRDPDLGHFGEYYQ